MKYKKKPIVVEAIQWNGGNPRQVFNFLENITDEWTSPFGIHFYIERNRNERFRIKTIDGNPLADLGDYIIKDENGKFYSCKPDVFKETYEPA